MIGLVAQGRTEAEALMTDTCTIDRADPDASPVFNPDDGTYTTAFNEVYSGKCRIKPGGGFEVVAGGTELVKHRWTVAIPMTATGVAPDDRITVDTSELDPDLAGRVLSVVEVPAGSQLTARRLVCEVSR